MSLDEMGRQAAEGLRESVLDDVLPADMLASLHRTRTRRRMAVVAPLAAMVVAVAAVFTGARGHESSSPTGPAPTAPTSAPTPGHANGALFGAGNHALLHPHGVYAPPLSDGSSPTWSPDGSRIAVLAGGILITEARTGDTRRLPCPGCQEISWAPDGRTFAAAGVAGMPLGLVDADTGRVTQVPLEGVTDLRSVSWSPDSRSLAFLAVAPYSQQGAWTVRADGSQQTQFLVMLTTFPADGSGYSGALQVRWAPTSQSIAVLFATADGPGEHSAQGPIRLDVQTMHPDGATPNHLVYAGRCDCVGFQPNMVWSPDGTTVALFALHARPEVPRLDGDGRTVRVLFVRGSGPLSWQPLPRVP
jgi:hypothetical protein